jgi:hypothetical protein
MYPTDPRMQSRPVAAAGYLSAPSQPRPSPPAQRRPAPPAQPRPGPTSQTRPAAGSQVRPSADLPPRFAYTVIVSAPRFASGKSNADAVAAALVNMVYAQLGPRQNVLQGVDTRDGGQRSYALGLLRAQGIASDSLPETPLLYSAREGVFTKPGMISLQLTLDIVSQLERRGPSGDLLAVLLGFPMRHDLEFLPSWAAALEAAEAPERRMLQASPAVADKMKGRTFSLSERGAVSMQDIIGAETPEMRAGRSGPVVTSDAYVGSMDTYADLSVAGGMAGAGARRVTISHVVGSGGEHGPPELRQTVDMHEVPGVMIDVEARMFEKLPQIRNVSEEQSLSERALVVSRQGSTDEEATKREIQRVRLERARTRMSAMPGDEA